MQIHMMEGDSIVVDEGDLEAARELTETVEDARLYLYSGDRHLFIDDSLPDYDRAATQLATERLLAFLDGAS